MFIKVELTIKDRYESAIKNNELNIELESKNICELVHNDTIYGIKAAELTKCLNNIDKAIVYIWTPNCKGESCVSVGAVEDYCFANGFDLFVVCTDYSPEAIKIQRTPKRPFFSINHLYYGSKIFGESHTSKFEKELINQESREGRLLEFHNGKYKKSFNIN